MSVLVTDLLEGLSLEASQEELLGLLDVIADRLGVLSAVRSAEGGLRVSIVAGGITTVATVTTVSTVTSVASVAAFNGMDARPMVPAAMNTAAALANIANVIVS